MASFGVEQARERLRHATAEYAAVETGYNWEREQPQVNGETTGKFLQYRERLLEEKLALTGEVLRHLGLRVAPSHGSATTTRSVEPARVAGKLLPPPRLPRAEKLLKVQVPAAFAEDNVSGVDDQQQHDHAHGPSGGSFVGPHDRGILPGVRCTDERSHYRRHHTIAALRYDTTADWAGRGGRCWNTENEGPGAAVTTTPRGGGSWIFSQYPTYIKQQQQQQQQEEEEEQSWRQLKPLDHHPRQVSPTLKAALPAVLVESPSLADDDATGGRPFKRTRKISAEEEPDSVSNTGSATGGGGRSWGGSSHYAVSGSPLMVSGSESGSQRGPSLSPTPHQLPRLGLYVGAPLVNPSGSTGRAAISASASASANTYTRSAASGLSSDSDRIGNYYHAVSNESEHESAWAVGGAGTDDDDAAAAVRVLGLRNGYASAAAAAAVAATQPAPAAIMVGTKRAREVVDQAHAPIMPSAVNVVRPSINCGGGRGSTETWKNGKRSSAGTRQKTGKSSSKDSEPPAGAPRGAQACRDVGCHRRPIYAFKGDTKALCCPIHRSKEMVNVRHPLCRNESCFRQPSFGREGDQRASFCSEHKAPDMINVSSRRCQADGCLRHPNFGFQGDRRATFCCRHKATGMIDVVSRRCQHPGCVRRPLYAMAGQRAMFCRTHKAPEHTDVVSRRCNFEGGCDRHPSFGWKHTDGKARRCAHHRLEGMESVKVNNRRGGAAKNALKANQAR